MSRTAPLTYKRCILYIFSTNVGTEYFKHALYSPFFSSKCSLFHNTNLFGFCIIHILYTGCAKIKKNNSGAKGLMGLLTVPHVVSVFRMTLTVHTGYFHHRKNQTFFNENKTCRLSGMQLIFIHNADKYNSSKY